jgi:NADPH-dependent curcumin reductase CurA
VKLVTEELGFDAAYNYKTTPHMEALNKLCPDGIDMYVHPQ